MGRESMRCSASRSIAVLAHHCDPHNGHRSAKLATICLRPLLHHHYRRHQYLLLRRGAFLSLTRARGGLGSDLFYVVSFSFFLFVLSSFSFFPFSFSFFLLVL